MRKAALDMVHALAREDDRIVFVGSDLGPDTLAEMRAEMPERFFMEGVSEAAVIGLAAGLAMDGFIPYVNTIATFITRRCYEQVALDLCLHDLPVRLIGNGGGLVYAPLGPTHLAIEDIAIMRALPNMTVLAVADADEMRRMMRAARNLPGPAYIRLGKGGDPVVTGGIEDFAIGRAYPLRAPGRVGFVSTGVMTGRALAACDLLAERGMAAGVLHMPTVKPLDAEGLLGFAAGTDLLVTVEEHVLAGGLGSAVLECLADAGRMQNVLRLGIPDRFAAQYGSQDSLLALYGLQPDAMAERVAMALGQPAGAASA
ncbi:MAG: transketolase family protein [Alphaproteobacteria bacterium]